MNPAVLRQFVLRLLKSMKFLNVTVAGAARTARALLPIAIALVSKMLLVLETVVKSMGLSHAPNVAKWLPMTNKCMANVSSHAPGQKSGSDAAAKVSRKKKPKLPNSSQRHFMLFVVKIAGFAKIVRLVAVFPTVVVFVVCSAWVTRLMHFFQPSPMVFPVKSGEEASSEKQIKVKMPFPCPGPSTKEDSFVHGIPNKPNAEGRYVCRKCKRGSVKGSVSCFVKTLCHGHHATTRSDAIRASRCVAGISKSGLPEILRAP